MRMYPIRGGDWVIEELINHLAVGSHGYHEKRHEGWEYHSAYEPVMVVDPYEFAELDVSWASIIFSNRQLRR